MKRCPRCQQTRPLGEFYFKPSKNKHYCYCKSCCISTNKKYKTNPWVNRKRKYGITEAQYQEQLKLQGHRCAICNVDLRTLPTKQVHVDHDHATRKLRGVLCQKCNLTLGQLNDDREYLMKIKDYLEAGGAWGKETIADPLEDL